MLKAKVELNPTVTIEVEAPEGASVMDGQKHLIETISFWQGIPSACPMPGCGAPLRFFARHPKNFHYYGLVCEGVPGGKAHEMNFGERKDGTTLYVKDDGWSDAYRQDDDSSSGPATQTAATRSATGAAAASPGGGQPIQPATTAMLMRLAEEKKAVIGNVLAFIKECAKADPALTRLKDLNITAVKELQEPEAQAVIANLGYV